MFGVGTKRAVVALAEQTSTTSRKGTGKTFRIEIDEDWLNSDSWFIPVYEMNEIAANTTIVDMSKLRILIGADAEAALRSHLSETYALFLTSHKLRIILNDILVAPSTFDNWAFPPNFQPRCYLAPLKTEDGLTVSVEMAAGLINARGPGEDNYGVYFLLQ